MAVFDTDKSLNELIRDLIAIGFEYTREERKCPAFTDRDYVLAGVCRVFSQSRSGRDFLQCLQSCSLPEVKRGTFFSTLHSGRRTRMVTEIASGLANWADRGAQRDGIDYLEDFSDLAGLEVFAGDGHSIEHACHACEDDGKYAPSSAIYLLNLRTGISRPFATVSGNGKRRHEMPVLKSTLPGWNAPGNNSRGRVIVYDRAAIDNQFWTLQARRQGLYVICRMRSNMTPVFRQPMAFDADDPVNLGIKGFFLTGFINAGTVYEVLYEDPETGTEYSFFTTAETIKRPGLIAWLYFLRWRIEKMFDNFENDFEESKEWANGNEAQLAHMTFVSMAYNISRIILTFMKLTEGVGDRKVEEKFEKDLERREQVAATKDRKVHPLHRITLPNRMPKLSLQFIRALRNHILLPSCLAAILPILTACLLKYL